MKKYLKEASQQLKLTFESGQNIDSEYPSQPNIQ